MAENIIVDKTLFIRNLEELLLFFNSQKVRLVEFIKNNFKENIHYIIRKEYNNEKKGSGGHNKINYLLTDYTFNITQTTFNLKHRYVRNFLDNVEHINILMSLENQTIGWIENSYKDVERIKRQYIIGTYKVDLYFKDYKLVVECDENNHEDRDEKYEFERQKFIISTGKSIIRFDPNNKNFDLSFVLREIHKFIKNYFIVNTESKLIIINYE
jgi:very-short-patch-repair endonuclease